MQKKSDWPVSTPSGTLRFLLLVVFSSTFGWILSGVIHEFGHALAILAFGGKITKLQPLVLIGPPHITSSGNFTAVQQAIIYASGAGLVFLVGVVTWIVYPFHRSPTAPSFFVVLTTIPFVTQSLSYIFLPLLHLIGISLHDDVIKFLKYSHTPPLLVSIQAFFFLSGALSILYKRVRLISLIQSIAANL
jgi:hypothetical protein